MIQSVSRRTVQAFLSPRSSYHYNSRFPLLHRCFSFPSGTNTNEENVSTSLNNDDITKEIFDERRNRLWTSLQELEIDAQELDQAAISSLEDPTMGYDNRYGKSAIRTYRSFLFSTKQPTSFSTISATAAANRCARQIQFLLNRHKSHQAEFVRHHDTPQQSSRKTFPIILLLDNVRSAFNVGSIFRTADACGVSLVVTVGITPHPEGSGQEKLNKSALGAERLVPSVHFATTRQALEFLRNEKSDYQIIGMETTERSQLYSNYSYPASGVVLLLGNEVTGVDTDVMNDLDAIVEIPMYGAKNSLNIAACAPVVLYEVLRQWSWSKCEGESNG
ncbi:tRNA (guanosine-2'-O-)-methyltransferase [Fistulifera solaris]|uniref:tRNA (Guanosine-2'-O-)-methyltransferase n=1 Tax=Fistulifera solaris TaxID=1519565 RepID=A0A1Z5JF83_FISSO|nr:tRNA (guanosine-2'-O-)-methyltransferase [Fistulifera solaris]|eukprot:GAX12629.1 tRNA (guanosine-2'-O-)-methyltransferase [Fistulifera solaris]